MKQKIYEAFFLYLFLCISCLSVILIGLGIKYIIETNSFWWFGLSALGGLFCTAVGYSMSYIDTKIEQAKSKKENKHE